MDWEMVVGMEVHAQLNTRSKLFCGCPTSFGAPANTHTCPVCLGLPGSLPVVNRAAFEKCLAVCQALQCEIPERCGFDRKNYFYPDLPKNYQISQEYVCFGRNGSLEIDVEGTRRSVRIHNVHLEEDAGKLVHPDDGSLHSEVDLNRAGTPLAEIVTQPDMRSVAEVEGYMTGLRDLLLYLDVCDGRMQEGSLRFEASISMRRAGDPELGPRVEVKNLNSMRAVRLALEYEQARQTAVLEAGGRIEQETRQWDESERLPWSEPVAHTVVQTRLPKDFKGKTHRMRGKEQAQDYRYFPEPDLPPLAISGALLERLRAAQPELPLARRDRLQEAFGLSAYDARLLTSEQGLVAYFEQAAAGARPKDVANWLLNDVASVLNARRIGIEAFPMPPLELAGLLKLVEKRTINRQIAKEKVFPQMLESGLSAAQIVARDKLAVESDEAGLRACVASVLAENPRTVAAFREGKTQVVGFVIGQVMRQKKGKADPQLVRKLALEGLGGA